jgi:hypothetical protein
MESAGEVVLWPDPCRVNGGFGWRNMRV